MKFFAKVKYFFSRLFMGKKVEEVVKEDPREEEEEVKVEEEVPVAEETPVATEEAAPEATKVEATEEVEAPVEEKEELVSAPVFACFTDQDKDGIIDILRPIVKGFNSDALYVNLCTLLEESKVLKTFTSLSEDKKTLTIKFTQNALFNTKLGAYIAEHVVSEFQSNIDAAALGQYTVTADSDAGTIEIKKVG